MSNLRRAQRLLDDGATPLQIIQQIFPDFNASRIATMSENAVLKKKIKIDNFLKKKPIFSISPY